MMMSIRLNGSLSRVAIVDKFGENADCDTGTAEDIWSTGGVKTYTTTADVLEVLSSGASAADDAAAGTGARTVSISGIDVNYNLISEEVTMNGGTAVETTQEFMDVYRAFVLTAGSGATNAGTIVIRQKTGPVTLAEIPVGQGQTFMSHYRIPAGFTGYLQSFTIGISGGGSNKDADIWIEKRTPEGNSDGSAWRQDRKLGVSSQGGPVQVFTAGLGGFAEKTAIKFKCLAFANNTRCFAHWDMVLVKNTEVV